VSGGASGGASAAPVAGAPWVKVAIAGCAGLAAMVILAFGLTQLVKSPAPTGEPKSTVPSSATRVVAEKVRFVILPKPQGRLEAALDTDRIAMFQDPATSEGGQIAVVYRDGHVVTLSTAEATRAIERQTGKKLADVMSAAVFAQP